MYTALLARSHINKVYIVENTTCSGEKRTLYQMYGIANVRYFEVYFTKIKKELRP